MRKRFLITGANGMLGTAVVKVIEAAGSEAVRTDLKPDAQSLFLDVRDLETVHRLIDRERPDWVFHLAAETDVDRCEKEPDHAFSINTLGTENVALACQAKEIPMLYISTGGVFDGQKTTPYTEFDAPNPVNVYARTKWEGEKALPRHLRRYVIVRTGWLIGGGLKDKKFVAKILKRMETEEKIPVVTDKFGSPTFTEDLAQQLVRFLEKGRYGLFHMANHGFCSRFDVAAAIREYLGREEVTLQPVSSDAFPLPAPRGRSEALENYKLRLLGLDGMRPWQEALKDYLDTLIVKRSDEDIVHSPIPH